MASLGRLSVLSALGPGDRVEHRLAQTGVILTVRHDLATSSSCVEAIRRHLPGEDREILVVPVGEDPDTLAWLEWQADLRYFPDGASLGARLNAALEQTTSETVLFLDDGVLLTPGSLDAMHACLDQGDPPAAVGPLISGVGGQSMLAAYQSLEELDFLAGAYNGTDPSRTEERLQLSERCLLVERAALDAVGGFDERLDGPLSFFDLELRLRGTGRRLVCRRDVLVHGTPALLPSAAAAPVERSAFSAKWGFDPVYSTFVRSELVAMLPPPTTGKPMRVLEVGCACGATLLEIHNQRPDAELFGVEPNLGAAEVASQVASVRACGAEEDLGFPEAFFDCIILADVLEHLADPWAVLDKLGSLLPPGGTVLASIPNVMHVSVLRGLLNGRWHYEEAGILDQTHLRFFTLAEIDELFAGAGFTGRGYTATVVPLSADDRSFIEGLGALSSLGVSDQFGAYQYLVRASR